MPELSEPLADATAETLRRAVLDLHRHERRRRFVPSLHAGTPAGAEASYVVLPREPLDHSLRADVVAALLRRTDGRDPGDGLVWLTRPGELALHDLDAQWLAAAGQCCAETGRSLTFVVVTRQGWWDPRTGLRRVWRRLRVR